MIPVAILFALAAYASAGGDHRWRQLSNACGEELFNGACRDITIFNHPCFTEHRDDLSRPCRARFDAFHAASACRADRAAVCPGQHMHSIAELFHHECFVNNFENVSSACRDAYDGFRDETHTEANIKKAYHWACKQDRDRLCPSLLPLKHQCLLATHSLLSPTCRSYIDTVMTTHCSQEGIACKRVDLGPLILTQCNVADVRKVTPECRAFLAVAMSGDEMSLNDPSLAPKDDEHRPDPDDDEDDGERPHHGKDHESPGGKSPRNDGKDPRGPPEKGGRNHPHWEKQFWCAEDVKRFCPGLPSAEDRRALFEAPCMIANQEQLSTRCRMRFVKFHAFAACAVDRLALCPGADSGKPMQCPRKMFSLPCFANNMALVSKGCRRFADAFATKNIPIVPELMNPHDAGFPNPDDLPVEMPGLDLYMSCHYDRLSRCPELPPPFTLETVLGSSCFREHAAQLSPQCTRLFDAFSRGELREPHDGRYGGRVGVTKKGRCFLVLAGVLLGSCLTVALLSFLVARTLRMRRDAQASAAVAVPVPVGGDECTMGVAIEQMYLEDDKVKLVGVHESDELEKL